MQTPQRVFFNARKKGLMDLWKSATVQPDVAYELRTANLIALYGSALCDTLNDSERLRIENTILERLGIKDA